MPRRREIANVGVQHGDWGEEIAVERLRLEGMQILDLNSRPVADDQRLEIDVVAYDPNDDALVFVEVKQHKNRGKGYSRLRSITRRKLANLRRACNAWRRRNRWNGNYRFDVMEIYGEPGCRCPEIDHVMQVNLFTDPKRFVHWG